MKLTFKKIQFFFYKKRFEFVVVFLDMFCDTFALPPLLGFFFWKKNLFEFADLVYHVLRHLGPYLDVAELRGEVL